MKNVTLTVRIEVQVPDSVESDLLHLGNNLEDFRIEESGIEVEAKVLGYETTDVEDN